MTATDYIGGHLVERYARQGYDVDGAHLSPARFGWLFEADLHAGGRRHRVTATGHGLQVTFETISPADADPFTPAVTAPRPDMR